MHASKRVFQHAAPFGPQGCALLLFTVGCAGGSVPPRGPGTPPTADPVSPATAVPTASPEAADPGIPPASFTAMQVERGRDLFVSICAECHSSSEFRGRDFRFRWRRRSAWKFYQNLTLTMPDDAPGSLADQEYVDVISYILEMNGYPAGTAELSATRAAMDQLMMDGGPNP